MSEDSRAEFSKRPHSSQKPRGGCGAAALDPPEQGGGKQQKRSLEALPEGGPRRLAEAFLGALEKGSARNPSLRWPERAVEERMAGLAEERLRELEKHLMGRTGPKHEFYQYWSREDGFFWEKRTGHRFVNPCLAARCVEAELEGPLLFPELYLEGGDARAEEWKRIVPAWASDVLSRATGLSDVTRAARLCRLADLVYRERAFRDARARW